MSDTGPVEQTATSTFYQGWHDYQDHLVTAIRPLSADQLALRAAPQLRSIGEIATHMIGARARWYSQVLGEGDEAFIQHGQVGSPGDAVARYC